MPPSVNPRFRATPTAAPDPVELLAGLRSAQPSALGRAITLIESQAVAHRAAADALLRGALSFARPAHRIGVTGVPGVGKSTFLEALGMRLLAKGIRIAVLAVDPSSQRTGGSILGDKSRMPQLAAAEGAYVRPSPAQGSLGGVARRTREAILLMEAAGFDVVFVETVGVGQSEMAVASMVDTFLLLMLAGAGDELQGIKRGIMEMADVLAITKSDGENQGPAQLAQTTYRSALRLFPPTESGWTPLVERCSALSGEGLEAVWAALQSHRTTMVEGGWWERRRHDQRAQWFDEEFQLALQERALRDAGRAEVILDAEAAAARGVEVPSVLARQLAQQIGGRS